MTYSPTAPTMATSDTNMSWVFDRSATAATTCEVAFELPARPRPRAVLTLPDPWPLASEQGPLEQRPARWALQDGRAQRGRRRPKGRVCSGASRYRVMFG